MNAIHQLLTDHIDIWTAADTEKKAGRGRSAGNAASVYGIKKLRELILELAVRGNLVPQDPSDEPASELLKRIQAEKAKLIAEGKIKKDKPLAAITEYEKPFALPQGWESVRLGDVACSQAGFAFKSNGFNESGLGLPLIRIRDVGQVFTGTYFEGDYRDEFVVIESDYLISMDGEFRVAKWLNEKALLNQRVSRLIFFGSETASEFVAESLQARLRELQGVKAYTTVDHLSGGQISNSVIALPPVSEQYRIVAKVDKLMALCDQLETQHSNAAEAHEKLVSHLLGTLTLSQSAEDFSANWQRIAAHFDTLFTTEASIDALKQTLLQLAVMGKLVSQDPNDEPASELLKHKEKNAKERLPFQIPDSWTWARVDEIAQTRLGKMLDKAKNKGTLVRYLRNINVRWFNFDLSDVKEMRFEASELEEFALRYGDVLICEGGYPGRAAVWDEREANIYFQKAIHRVRFQNGINPYYFVNVLRESVDSGRLNSYFTGAGIQHFTGKGLMSFLVPLPPLSEQHRVVAKVDELMAICDQLKTRITEANQLQQKLADVVVEQAIS